MDTDIPPGMDGRLGVDAPWTLQVLPRGAENLIALGTGWAPSRAAAFDAATGALVEIAAALGKIGRQEYRITVAGRLTIVLPGVTEDGLVDLDALHEMAFRYRVG